MAYNILKEAGYNVKFLDASIQIKKKVVNIKLLKTN